MFDDSRGKKKPSQHDFICRLENLLQKEKQVLHLQKRPPSRRALPYEILIYSICMYVYIYLYIAVYIHFYSRNLILCHKYITYPALSDDSSFSMVETSEINLDPSGIIACLSACMSWQQYVLVHIYIYLTYVYDVCIYICCKLAPK